MMSFLNQHAAEIVLLFLTSLAFSLVIVIHRQRRKQDRDKQHAIDSFFEKSAQPTTSEQGDDEAAVKSLLTQAIAGTQQSTRALNDTQERLEAISARISRLEDKLIAPRHSGVHKRF